MVGFRDVTCFSPDLNTLLQGPMFSKVGLAQLNRKTRGMRGGG